MKRGMLGTTEVDTAGYWTEGKNSQELRVNETILYAEIDKRQELANLWHERGDATGVQKQYNEMDMFYLMLRAIGEWSGDEVRLRRAGVVIGNMVAEGKFSGVYPSIEAENAAVARYVEEMKERVNAGANKEPIRNASFLTYYTRVVVERNYYHNTDGSKTQDTPRLEGLGTTATDDYETKNVKEGGAYFCYLVSDVKPSEAGKKKYVVHNKKMCQDSLMQKVSQQGNNLSTDSMMIAAESGMIAKSGLTKEEFMKQFQQDCVRLNELEKAGRKVEVRNGEVYVDGKRGVEGLGEPITATCLAIAFVATSLIAMFIKSKLGNTNSLDAAYAEAFRDKLTDDMKRALSDGRINEFTYLNQPDRPDWLDLNGDGIVDEDEMKFGETLISPLMLAAVGACICGIVWALSGKKKPREPEKLKTGEE